MNECSKLVLCWENHHYGCVNDDGINRSVPLIQECLIYKWVEIMTRGYNKYIWSWKDCCGSVKRLVESIGR